MTAEEQTAKLSRLAQMPHENLVVEYLQLEVERDCAVDEIAQLQAANERLARSQHTAYSEGYEKGRADAGHPGSLLDVGEKHD
jgi:hypothetical protein